MKKMSTKKGIASFYMVAIATLLLSVLAVGFSTVVVNEMNRTTNFDLSKSAYDSALAGIEDAKVAIMNYQSCLTNKNLNNTSGDNPNDKVTCEYIINEMKNVNCFMVGHILGRIGKSEQKEVLIKETSVNNANNNKMQQAYTCVKISYPSDYRTTLNSSNSTRVIPIKIFNEDIANIKSIRISWTDNTGVNYNNTNFNGTVVFPPVGKDTASNPPTLGVQLVQTSTEFQLSDFDYSQDNRTDRGTIYMVPADGETGAQRGTRTNTYIDMTAGSVKSNGDIYSTIEANEGFVKSNDKTAKNLPFLVNCPKDSSQDFLCSAVIKLPEPIGGVRSTDTFMLVVSLPYGGPNTDIAISVCNTTDCAAISTDENLATGDESNTIKIANQIRIDSTGRANNLFRRVESRIETDSNQFYNFAYDAIQALGNRESTTIDKRVVTNVEIGLDEVPSVHESLTKYQLTYINNDPLCQAPDNMPMQQTVYNRDKATFVIASNEPTCGNNLTFMGWAQNEDRTGAKYQPGNTIESITTEKRLYAVWKPKQHVVKYHNYNDPDFNYDITPLQYGQTTIAKSRGQLSLSTGITPPKHDETYQIVGWTTRYGNTTVEYAVGEQVPKAGEQITADINLYAIWSKTIDYNFYQIDNNTDTRSATFVNDIYNVEIDVPMIQDNVSFNIDNNQIRRDNLTVKGWSTVNSKYISPGFNPGAKITVNDRTARNYYATIYYTAQINYYISNQEYSPSNRNNKIIDVNIISKGSRNGVNVNSTKILLARPSKEEVGRYSRGMDFDYWRVGVDSNAAEHKNANTEYTNTVDVNMYAVLKAGVFRINFYSYDGSLPYGYQDITYGENNQLRAANATSGWTNRPIDYSPDTTKYFYGWSLDADKDTTPDFGQDASHNVITTEIYSDGHKMYAIWRKDITVNFISGNGKDAKNATFYNNTMSANITAPAIPATSDGYAAYTWSSLSTSINDNWNVGATRAISDSTNRHAAYSKTVTITYDKGSTDATGTMEASTGTAYRVISKDSNNNTTTITLDAPIKLKNNEFSNTGHNFNKWAIGNAAGELVEEGKTITINTSITAYANWNARIYTINLNNNGATSAGSTAIYEKYGVGFTLKSDGSNLMRTNENPITKPIKEYKVSLYYAFDTGSNTSTKVSAGFTGYYTNGMEIITKDGYIYSNTLDSRATTANYPDAGSIELTASWNAGVYDLPAAETKTGYNCAWRAGNASGSAVSGTQSITSDIGFYSVCTLATKIVTISVTSDGYVSQSSTPDNAASRTIEIPIVYGTTVTISGNKITFSGDQGSYYAHANTPSQYEFLGWTGLTSGSTITSDITISGSWKLSMISITVTTVPGCALYDGNGNNIPSRSQTFHVEPNTTVQISGANITIGHYLFSPRPLADNTKFDSWSVTNGTTLTESTTITGTIKEKEYTCSGITSTETNPVSYNNTMVCVSSGSEAVKTEPGSCYRSNYTYTTVVKNIDYSVTNSSSPEYVVNDWGIVNRYYVSCSSAQEGIDYQNKISSCGGTSGGSWTCQYTTDSTWDTVHNAGLTDSGQCLQSVITYYIHSGYTETCNNSYSCNSGWNVYNNTSGASLQCYKNAKYE